MVHRRRSNRMQRINSSPPVSVSFPIRKLLVFALRFASNKQPGFSRAICQKREDKEKRLLGKTFSRKMNFKLALIAFGYVQEELLLFLSLFLSFASRSWWVGALPVAYVLYLRIRPLCSSLKDLLDLIQSIHEMPAAVANRSPIPNPTGELSCHDSVSTPRRSSPDEDDTISSSGEVEVEDIDVRLVRRHPANFCETDRILPEAPAETIYQMGKLGVSPETARRMVALSQSLMPAMITPLLQQVSTIASQDPNFLSKPFFGPSSSKSRFQRLLEEPCD